MDNFTAGKQRNSVYAVNLQKPWNENKLHADSYSPIGLSISRSMESPVWRANSYACIALAQ